MNAKELMLRYGMEQHPENGSFAECHYENEKPGRAASGSIYYYVAAGEQTEFHQIDCDEYWCYVAGMALEVWMVDAAGELRICKLGTDIDCEPLLYIRRGTIFASRSLRSDGEGTFLSCITVPRFMYEGFSLIRREEMCRRYPETAAFYEAQKET